MTTANSDSDLLGRLAAEWRERLRRGERPQLEEYTARYPELAEPIRKHFPTVVALEDLKGDALDATGAYGAAPAPPDRLERLGDFRILREVGRGGMGVVYEAEQESLGRRVALKVLPSQALLEPDKQKRFRREARATARLHHTNIVPVFGVGEHDGAHYYVMQFIQGQGLDQVIAELRRQRSLRDPGPDPAATVSLPLTPGGGHDGPAAEVARSLLTGRFTLAGAGPADSPGDSDGLGNGAPAAGAESATPPPSGGDSTSAVHAPGPASPVSLTDSGRPYWRSVARIGVQVADALAYAHGQGVLHRDVKPANLLLDARGTVWVTDFGLAKVKAEADNLTHTGEVVGTLRYMPPERFSGQADARGDVYGLGLTLYELLTLRPAHPGEDRHGLIHQILHDDPPPPRRLNPAVPRDLETVVLKAMARDPAHRYATAADLAADLRRFLEDRPIRARRARPHERLWRWCRRNPALATAVGLAAAALLAVTVVATLFAFAQADFADRQVRSNQELVRRQRQIESEKERAEKALRRSERLATELAAALKTSNRQAAVMAAKEGQAQIEQGRPHRGMLWLARALELAPAGEPDFRDAVRTALAGLPAEAPVLQTVLPHRHPVDAALFSPDGRFVLTTGGDYATKAGEALLWDAATGKPVGKPIRPSTYLLAAALSPDGKTVLAGGANGTARLWDVTTGRPAGEPWPHLGAAFAVAFSPDGKTALIGDAVEAVLREVPGGKQVWRLPQAGPVRAVAFSPDGKAVLTGGQDRAARLWQAASGKPLGKPMTHPGQVIAAAFRPDGKVVVTGCVDRMVRLWDAATGEPVGQSLEHPGAVTAAGFSVGFSPDGRFLLTAGGGAVQLWEADTGRPVGAPLPAQGFLLAAAFRPDGRAVVIPGTRQAAEVWALPTGRLARPPLPHRRGVSVLAFSRDGRRLLTRSGDEFQGRVRVWDAATGQPLGPAVPQEGWQLAVALSPDGKTMLAGEQDGSARLWNAATGKPVGRPLRHPGYLVYAAAFSPDGKTVLTAAQETTARFWDAATGRPTGPPLLHRGYVLSVAYRPDGKAVATGSIDPTTRVSQVRLWDPASGQPLRPPLRLTGAPMALRFSPDGRTLAAACQDGTARLWEVATGRPAGPPVAHQGAIYAVAFSPDGRVLVTAGDDRLVRLWGARSGQPLGAPLRHPKPALAAAFTPDGSAVVTGCEDGYVRFWQPPARARGTARRLKRWAEVVTGQELDADGRERPLAGAEWQARREELARLGGPPAGPPGPALPWHQAQALDCLAAGKWDAALWHLDRGLGEQPDDWLARVLRTRVHLQLGRPDRAEADLARALKREPAAPVLAWFDFQATECAAREQWSAAFWYLDHLLKARPKDADLYLRRAQTHAKRRRWPEAAADYERAAALKRDPDLWLEGGRCHARRKQWDRVAADFAKGLELLPGDFGLFSRRSVVCEEVAQWDQAFTRLLELRPGDGHLLVVRARLNARRGRWDQAAADLVRARVEERPVNEESVFEYACLLLLRGDEAGYRRLCTRLVRRAGATKDPFTAYVLARTCGLAPGALDDPARAVGWGEQGVAGNRAAWTLHALAAAHYRAKHLDRAVKLSAESNGLPWQEAHVINGFLLAMAHHRLGHAAKARDWLDRAAALLDKNAPSGPDQPTAMPSTDWLEAQVLRRQAEELIRGKPRG